jgi:hypothetical protein
MVAEVYAGLSAFKAAFDIAKGLKDIHDATLRNAAVIQLQEKILSAQAEQASLIQRISELEKEVAGLKSWNAEKKRYELKRYHPGALFYTLKEAEAHGEPIHHLCAKCYKNDKPSIIQPTGNTMAREPSHFCPECKTQFIVHRTPINNSANF